MPADYANVNITNASTLDEELLKLATRQARITPLPATLGTLAIAAMSLHHLPAWIVGCWVILVFSLLLSHQIILVRLPKLTQKCPKKRLHTAIVLTMAVAFSYSLSLGFFPFLSDFERAILTVSLISICSTSIMITAGYRPILLIYFAFTLIPLFILWGWHPGSNSDQLSQSILLIGVLYCLLQYRIATDIFQLQINAIENRQRLVNTNAELQTSLEKTASESKAKTRFLASASHDLRQPIDALSLFCATLNKQSLNERNRLIGNHMAIALNSLSSQLEALLDISRLDAGAVAAHCCKVNLSTIIERLGDEFSPIASDKGLSLEVSAPPLAVVNTDQLLLERIIRNLLYNAIKYTEHGYIQLQLISNKTDYRLQVIDTGPGIAKEFQDKIFEQFYQPDINKDGHSKGLGLGLAIARQLTELLSVELELTSSVGSGSTFSLIIQK